MLDDNKAEIDKIERQEFKYGQKNRHYVSPSVGEAPDLDPFGASSTFTTLLLLLRCRPSMGSSLYCSSSMAVGTTPAHDDFRNRTTWGTVRWDPFSPRVVS